MALKEALEKALNDKEHGVILSDYYHEDVIEEP